MPFSSIIFSFLLLAALSRCVPPCYPSTTSPSLFLADDHFFGDDPHRCCQLNNFREICSGDAPGVGGVTVNFTYVEDDALLSESRGWRSESAPITGATQLSRDSPTGNSSFAVSPDIDVSIFYTLNSRTARTAEISVIKADTYKTVRLNSSVVGPGKPTSYKCRASQLIANTGSQPVFKESDCTQVCMAPYRDYKHCTDFVLCSQPLRFKPTDNRRQVREFWFAVVEMDLQTLIHLDHVALDTTAADSTFYLRGFQQCNRDGPTSVQRTIDGRAMVVGNPETTFYQVAVKNLRWVTQGGPGGTSGLIETLWLPPGE